jgi:fucose permease
MAKVNPGRLIIAAILAIFVYGVIAAMLGTIMPSWKLTPEQNGNIALAQAIGLVIASLSAGPIIDNKGKKSALVTGLALIAIALFSLAVVSGYDMYMAFMLLLGLGGGIIVTAANALVADINVEKRSSTLNLLNLFFGLGGLATPFIAGNLLDNDAQRLCYVGGALAAVTFLVHITTTMPPPSGERGFKMSEAGDLISSPTLWLLSLFLFLYVAAEVGVWNWFVSYLITTGISETDAKNILSLGFALGLLVGRVVASRILHLVTPITVTLISSILMAITTYMMLNSGSPTIAWIAVFCGGLAMAPVFPTTLGITGDAFPKATATAMGIVITFGWVGLIVSSRIIGAIGGTDPKQLGKALLVLPIASVLMVLVNLALRPMLAKARN